MKRIGEILQGISMWMSILILTIVVASLVLILFPFVYFLDRERHSLHCLANIWAKWIQFLNPWWHFHVMGKENLAKNGDAVVYVSNHQSQADILALFILNTRFRWLSKASVFKIPFLGWAMHAVGYVPVERGNKKSGERCMHLSGEHLKKGTPMVFFPEGTRSKTGQLGQFKTGAFRLAKALHVPIVPITLNGCSDLLPKGSWFPKKAEVTITVHKKIDTETMTVEQMMELAHQLISSQLPEALR